MPDSYEYILNLINMNHIGNNIEEKNNYLIRKQKISSLEKEKSRGGNSHSKIDFLKLLHHLKNNLVKNISLEESLEKRNSLQYIENGISFFEHQHSIKRILQQDNGSSHKKLYEVNLSPYQIHFTLDSKYCFQKTSICKKEHTLNYIVNILWSNATRISNDHSERIILFFNSMISYLQPHQDSDSNLISKIVSETYMLNSNAPIDISEPDSLFPVNEYELFWYLVLESLLCFNIISEEANRIGHKGKRATVYITKKNITNRSVSSMYHSLFNDYFGFVEFDNLVDLNLMSSIEREFELLNRDHFYRYKNRNEELRFRKLRRHRVSGMYYPDLHSMLVDFRSPGVFIHEYFHLIDFNLSEASNSDQFIPIHKLYKECLESEIKGLPESTRTLLSGRSKFNLNYYLDRHEVFARCGELYLFNLGVKSSLLSFNSSHFAYPNANVYVALADLIDNYYAKTLCLLRKGIAS